MLYLPTNCGMIDLASEALRMLTEFGSEQLYTPGGPTLTTNRITYFHNTMCEWAFNIPLKFDWVVMIHTKGTNHRRYLLNEIKAIETGKYEHTGWKIGRSAEATFDPAVQDTVGCIFAQGVRIPGEKVNHELTSISGSNRGFINAPIITGRANFEPLEISFLETNQSFIDSFLRPWSILVAHRGLIANTSPDKDIKADIYVYQLSRIGTDQESKIRKTYVFENCAPIDIASDEMTYGSSSDYGKSQVKFAYSRYYIKETVPQ